MPPGGHPYEDFATTARALIRRANGSWRSLAGRLELWEDEAWLDDGRARYHGSPPSQVPPADEPKELAYRFVIASEPWRLRMVLLWSRPSPQADSDPDLMVVRGATWWARTRESLVTNDGDSRHSHGLYYLDLLTKPAGLADSLAYVSGAQAAEENRPVIRVNAAPTEVTGLRAAPRWLLAHEIGPGEMAVGSVPGTEARLSGQLPSVPAGAPFGGPAGRGVWEVDPG